jgi:CHAT domain-containing protein/Tfp pilus assembly protein PilF
MSLIPLLQRSLPRGASPQVLLGLSALLLGAATCRPAAAPSLNPPPAEREIHGGEVQTFPIELRAGQFLRVTAEEEGIDLALRLLDSQGVLVAGADSARMHHTEASEELAAVAETTGPHRLEVTAAGQGSGRYRLRIESPRTPAAADRLRAEAARAAWNGLGPEQASKEEQLRSLERAVVLWRRAGDLGAATQIQFDLGLERFEDFSAYEQALADFRQAAAYWGGQPGRHSRVLQAESLTWVGRCLRHSERRQEARAAHEQALALARELGESGLEAQNSNLLGRLDMDAGELRKGLDWLRQALAKARAAGDRKLESIILNNLAGGYEEIAEIQKALEYYNQALALARETADRNNEMIFLNNLGETYRSLGDWETAFDYYRVAAEMSGTSNKKPSAGMFLINLADAYRHRGQLDEARSSLDRALALGRQIDSRELQIFALDQIAFLLLQLKQPAPAAARAREAVGLGGSRAAQNLSRFALGSALLDLGETAAAKSELEKALDLARSRGDRGREAELDLVLTRMDRNGGDLASARSRIQSAIELIEARRGGVIDPELRTSFLASKQDYYELEIDTLMALHASADALQASEHARARGLLDTLNEAGADIGQGIDPVLVVKEREAREEVNARDGYRRELLAEETPDREKLAGAERKLQQALEQYQKVQVELRQSSPRYAALTQPQTLSVEEIERQVVDGGALLLEYSLGAKRSFLWAVSPDSFASFELPGREEIETAARRYYELLTVRNHRRPGEPLPAWKARIAAADAEAENAARGLAAMILAPAEPLFGERTLLIVADGALQYLPFAALPMSATGAPLVTRHVVVNLPSASVLAVLRRELRDRPRAGKTLAIFADPVFQKDDDRLSHGPGPPIQPAVAQAQASRRGGAAEESREKGIDLANLRRLTFSRKEADAIAALVPSGEVMEAVGFQASKAAVANDRLEDYRNVHFATHGIIDSVYPKLSGLVLSLYDEQGRREDGFLHLNDVYNLRLDADLVVLSACRTALGKEIRGEGLVGLTRGFMYAGSARVLASLWSVEDRATAELMESFYRGMLRGKLSPAAALRQAQMEMAQRKGRHSPYYWAGFSLQGEWR